MLRFLKVVDGLISEPCRQPTLPLPPPLDRIAAPLCADLLVDKDY